MKNGTCNSRCLVLGGVGALMACLAELTAKGEVSTMLRVREAMSTYLGLSIAPLHIMALFIVLGVVLTYASQVEDLKRSLYVGASIITIFLTIIPNGMPPSVGSDPQPTAREGGSLLRFALLSPAEALAQPTAEARGMGRVALTLKAEDDKPLSAVILTLRQAQGGGLVARSKLPPNHLSFSQRAGNYLLVIEVPGYRAVTRKVEITAGQSQELTINLKPSWQPLYLQRIFRSN